MKITIEDYTKNYPVEQARILGKTKKSDTLEYTTIIRMKNCIVRVCENGFKNPQHEADPNGFIQSIEAKIVKSKKLAKKGREIGMLLTYETLPAEPPKPKKDDKKKADDTKKNDGAATDETKNDEPEVVTGVVVDDEGKK